MSNIEELKRLAEAAGGDKWVSSSYCSGAVLDEQGFGIIQVEICAILEDWEKKLGLSGHWAGHPESHKDVDDCLIEDRQDFIAAANPAAVLELIAEVERVTEQRGQLESALERLVELANNDGLWCNYDEVIHAEAVLEKIYKSQQKAEG